LSVPRPHGHLERDLRRGIVQVGSDQDFGPDRIIGGVQAALEPVLPFKVHRSLCL
jgi:hypothetical protein